MINVVMDNRVKASDSGVANTKTSDEGDLNEKRQKLLESLYSLSELSLFYDADEGQNTFNLEQETRSLVSRFNAINVAQSTPALPDQPPYALTNHSTLEEQAFRRLKDTIAQYEALHLEDLRAQSELEKSLQDAENNILDAKALEQELRRRIEETHTHTQTIAYLGLCGPDELECSC
ncbi:hypothetical protein BT69DRAFT_265296 [Atractiella rhizophila]|nr:hypothetical protein BT69DRAFT_265296 [Atractiella rhizophila]